MLEMEDRQFNRMIIVFREGKQVFKSYAQCGICLDGTFLKNVSGGIPLIACVLNGNQQIQIVSMAIVSIVNEADWSFFLRNMGVMLPLRPSFILSDGAKELIPAVSSVYPSTYQFYCLRQLMENFNRKIRSVKLKNEGWGRAKTTSMAEYTQKAELLNQINPAALKWSQDVGVEKWSLAHRPCPRYGQVWRTSAFVEAYSSVHGVEWIQTATKDMLIEIDCTASIVKQRAAFPQKLPTPQTSSRIMPDKISCPSASTSLIAPFATEPSSSVPYTSSPFTSEPSLSTPSPLNVQHNIMLLPPEVAYSNREQLEDAVQTFARGQGYAVTIKSSIAGKRVYLKYDRGALNVNKLGKERQRQISSRRVGFPFLPQSCSITPSFRPFNAPEFNQCASLYCQEYDLGWCKTIMDSFNNPPNKGRSPCEPLYIMQWASECAEGYASWKHTDSSYFHDLQASKFLHFHRYNENGTITSLFFAHKESVRLSRQYHHVSLMDCIHKTNKYRLPILHIVGMTSFNSHFSVGFCFLKEEKQSDYTWALSKLAIIWTPETRPGVIVTDRELALMAAIDKLFSSSSHLLCVWHINKNILAKCKRQFETSEEWTVFLQQWCIWVAANTELEYEKQWKVLSDSFKTKPEVLEYLANTWLIYKERFVNAWTSKHLHFGNSRKRPCLQ
uniref:Pc21g00130 putative n=1 Tax=Albugo laibachii Nc14 TaxID=890382 RepID=F0WWS7_9STRA|nr:Pc21g00130 putative [Albugo laibachii Nc14]|eukprot:CCA25904.1 Pc21g00130 putative [Albugo laibachii Nc14]